MHYNPVPEALAQYWKASLNVACTPWGGYEFRHEGRPDLLYPALKNTSAYMYGEPGKLECGGGHLSHVVFGVDHAGIVHVLVAGDWRGIYESVYLVRSAATSGERWLKHACGMCHEDMEN